MKPELYDWLINHTAFFLLKKEGKSMITQMKTGKHKGDYQVRIQPVNPLTHKRESWPVEYAATKREAQKIERKMWADFEDGYRMSDANDCFVESFKKFVENRSVSISPVTLKTWQYSAKVFENYFGKAKIKNITTQTVNDFAHSFVKNNARATVSPKSSLSTRLTHMRCYFDTLIGSVVKTNPVPKKALAQFFQKNDFTVGKKYYVFTDHELELLVEKIKTDLDNAPITNWTTRLAIWCALETGMRSGEVQALHFSDVVSENGCNFFRIWDSWSNSIAEFNGSLKQRPKGATRDCLPISDELFSYIRQYHSKQTEFLAKHEIKNELDLMFINLHDYRKCNDQVPVEQRSMNDMLKRLSSQLEIDPEGRRLSMYSFRHTVCTKLANNPQISNKWAADRMGHSLLEFTNTYVDSDQDTNDAMLAIWQNR